jgi:hypothetical protein
MTKTMKHTISRGKLSPAIIAICLAAGVSAASAKPLSVTSTYDPAEIDDSKNAIGVIMKQVWSGEISNVMGSYGFSYALFEAAGKQYLVSSFRDGNCTPRECAWQVQRLSSSYEVEAAGKPFTACGELNKVDLTGDTLTICGKETTLP